jgi:hypothetical protein
LLQPEYWLVKTHSLPRSLPFFFQTQFELNWSLKKLLQAAKTDLFIMQARLTGASLPRNSSMPSLDTRQNGLAPKKAASQPAQPAAGSPLRHLEPLPLEPAYAATRDGQSTGGLREVWNEFVFDCELVGLVCVLIGLCLWFALMSPGDAGRDADRPATVAPAMITPTAPFSFVSSRGRDWLLPAILAASPTTEPRPGASAGPPSVIGREAAPLVTATVERHALIADPAFDPLGTVIVSGLPADTRLSAGTPLSPTGHAIAFGDLDNLVIRLPARRAAPIRTTLDLRTRSGLKIHSFSVEIQDVPDDPAGDEPAPAKRTLKKPKLAPVTTDRPPRKVPRKPVTGAGPIKPAPVVAKGPARTAPPPLPAAPPVAGPPGLSALLPLGIFKPDPKDSALNGLSPDLRDDPRFTTLRGLGMRPDLLPPSPAPPAPDIPPPNGP